MDKKLEAKSKFLCFLLRHKPEAAKLTLDKEGWCNIIELLANTDITFEELREIVETDEKQRYAFKYLTIDDAGIPSTQKPTHVRANQGHSSTQVDLIFKQAVPPSILYHGTEAKNLSRIELQGINPMKRQYVHLSSDIHTAKSVAGRRTGNTTILEINALAMVNAGFTFYLSDNGVWLVHHVPACYFKEHDA